VSFVDKPAEVFDRDREWAALTRFAADSQPGATLGVVSGRRRQGKSFLLEALCEAAGGFYFCAQEGTSAESLAFLGAALGRYAGAPAPLRFDSWAGAIDALLALGHDKPTPVVLDEFPYLAHADRSLPSTIQAAYGPRRPERTGSRARLLLCGSAMSFMGRMLSGEAPLCGRAGLDMVVRPLDHQLAAEFWGLEADPRLALQVNAIVGGTPAYRREFVRHDAPAGPKDFDPWVVRTVLDPMSPLFREARYLLASEAGINDTALYHSVLAAVATGNSTRGGIAGYIGRKATDITHPLTVLEDIGLLSRESDAFRANRSSYRIAEPLITFYHAVMRPVWPELEHSRDLAQTWARARKRFNGNVLGPHFERLCREWTWHMAPPSLLGDHPSHVSAGTVPDPANQTSHQLDVVAVGLSDDGSSPLLAIGEAKWNDVMGLGHLERLRRIRVLLADQGRANAAQAKLACYSAAGFTGPLREIAAESDDVVLVDLQQLYRR
jgi:AAA+ ATPase superfamily predicted ATPase